ncbi:hypothetical protein TNCT_204071 [Trichonephila clavata]|uniref:Uncharacterized protein n=1 Tax=Trichonephila clavata TaxID=2740835 RepID=A0A8X6L9F4_TRICU|nr:hypothetical protein TNCT_204071 [Trichonephila clavata]
MFSRGISPPNDSAPGTTVVFTFHRFLSTHPPSSDPSELPGGSGPLTLAFKSPVTENAPTCLRTQHRKKMQCVNFTMQEIWNRN